MNLKKIRDDVELVRSDLFSYNCKNAAVAFEMCMNIHNGTRKDGITPEYHHQVSIMRYLLSVFETIPIALREQALIVAALHDVLEDRSDKLSSFEISKYFGTDVVNNVLTLTKTPDKPVDVYYNKIGNEVVPSIVKGADRIHNIQTMVGAFNRDKQEKYMLETEEFVIPMLKAAGGFYRHISTYKNLLFILTSQLELVRNGIK